MNDIEYVREELSDIPMVLKFDALISRLSEVEGNEKALKSKRTLTNMIEAANDDVIDCFDEVVCSIADKVRTIHTHNICIVHILYCYLLHIRMQ